MRPDRRARDHLRWSRSCGTRSSRRWSAIFQMPTAVSTQFLTTLSVILLGGRPGRRRARHPGSASARTSSAAQLSRRGSTVFGTRNPRSIPCADGRVARLRLRMTDPTLPRTRRPRPRPPDARRPGRLDHLAGARRGASAPLLFIGGYLAGGGGGGGTGCAAPTRPSPPSARRTTGSRTSTWTTLDATSWPRARIRGMFQYGVEDPYSGYMAPEQYQQALGDLSGHLQRDRRRDGHPATPRTPPTSRPAPSSARPAAWWSSLRSTARRPRQAGLQAGDFVLAVDGETVDGTTMEDQITQIRGESGTDVTLTIERDGSEPFDVTITRAEITLQEVETRMIDGHIGYIALNGFSAPAATSSRDGARRSPRRRAPTRSCSTCATTRAATSTPRRRSPASSWTTA